MCCVVWCTFLFSAGTVFWTHLDGEESEPHGLSEATNTFTDTNRASYGEKT